MIESYVVFDDVSRRKVLKFDNGGGKR